MKKYILPDAAVIFAFLFLRFVTSNESATARLRLVRRAFGFPVKAAPPTASGNGKHLRNGSISGTAIMRMCILLIMCLCCSAPPLAAGENPLPAAPQYTIIKKYIAGIDQSKPPFHPRMKEAKNDYTMLSVQDEDLLRVFFYHPNGMLANAFDLHNPSKRDLSGMPARYQYKGSKETGSGEKYLVVFEDGTEFEPYLPPDAWCSGGPSGFIICAGAGFTATIIL